MKPVIALTIILAFALSACFNVTLPGNDTTLTPSTNVADIGESVTFTSEREGTIRIVEASTPIEPPQTVRNLPSLEGASVLVDDQTTLTVTLDEGRNEVLGRDVYRFDGSTTIVAYGETQRIDASSDIRLVSESAEQVRDGISSATFRIVRVGGSTTTYETVEIGETKTINLDGQSATFEITDTTMSGEELESLEVRASYQVPIIGTQSQTLDFTFQTGKRINTGSNTYDVFLDSVEYTTTTVGTDGLVIEAGSESAPLRIGEILELRGDVIIPVSTGSGPSATILINPTTLLVSNTLTRYPEVSLNVDHSYDRTTGELTIIQGDTDEVFSAYRVDRDTMLLLDTQSVEEVSTTSTSATYRFHRSGDYTAQITISDGREAQATVLIR